MENIEIAILDDQEEILSSFAKGLGTQGYQVKTFSESPELLNYLRGGSCRILFLDINLGEESGIKLIPKIKKLSPAVHLVMISGQADIMMAVTAMKEGADDFIEKPLQLQLLLKTIKLYTDKNKIINERDQLLSDALERYRMIGESKEISQIKELLVKYSGLLETVLICGPSGTGKELAAGNLHYLSERRSKPYFTLNIAALPDTLIESQLFGYKKGAFSGAVKDNPGILAEARDSTLFLDEIGELKPELQSKLLRVIQEREFTPLGSSKPVKINTRLIFATNKKLAEEVKKGNFREDLYFRISALTIELPALKERSDDLEQLVPFLIKKLAGENNIEEAEVTEGAMKLLKDYPFPGNIRELKNILLRTLLRRGKGEPVSKDNLALGNELSGNENDDLFKTTDTLHNKKKELEKKYLEEQLKIHKYEIKSCSEDLGILPNNLYRKIKEFDINVKK